MQQRDFCLLFRVREDPFEELDHRRDARSAGDEGDVLEFVRFPGIRFQGAEDEKGVSWFEGVDVCACLTAWVALDYKVNEAGFI